MRRIDLEEPLPIHIRYFTVTYDGKTLQQYGDVYGHDKKLIKEYYQSAPVVAQKRPGA
jgi:murein L,D-transpeptidase YcbB/YkuD